nr:cytochrome b [Agamermis sp. BH-2006]
MYVNFVNEYNKLKLKLKAPLNLSYWWNLGSFVSLIMSIQIITGLFLTFYYENSENCFDSIYIIHIETFYGVLVHFIHLNVSSIIFFLIYLHMTKGLIFSSFSMMKITWISGWIMMMLSMLSAFMGYVLPWGQMSLWGATVITNLLSAIPVIGKMMVEWIWGGYFVSNFTMKMFFSFHFLVPFIILIFIMIHLIILHYYGSNNPIGNFSLMKIEFNPIYSFKDLMSIIFIILMFVLFFYSPYFMVDPENFIKSNPMISPIHIQPEWYFLQYYAILRAIPNKLGGVLFFLLSLILLMMMIFFNYSMMMNNMKLWNLMTIMFIMSNIILVWLGGMPVEYPYLILSQILTFIYFLNFLLIYMFNYLNFILGM